MFDITPLEKSFGQSFYCGIFYMIFLLVGYLYNMSYDSRQAKSQFVPYFLIGGVFIYSLTSFTNGDYFHYYEYIKKLNKVTPERGLEPVYQYLILFLNKNYLLFRICVWGTALILYIKTLKRFKVDIEHAFFFLLACFLNTFSYARASLGMAMFFYGYSIFYNPHKNINSNRAIGILLILGATFLHKSMLIMVVLWIITCIIPFNRKSIFCMLCIFPIIVHLFGEIFGHILETNLIQDKIILGKMNGYKDRVSMNANWKGMIQQFLQYSTYYFPLAFATWKLWFNKEQINVEKKIRHLTKLVFITIYVASCFPFITSNNLVFFYRILFMTMIPITILITYLVDHNILELKYYKLIVWLGILYSIQTYLAAVYLTF